MCIHTPPLRLKSSARGKGVQFKGCSWSFLGASRGAIGGLKGVQLQVLGASRQVVLLEISGTRGGDSWTFLGASKVVQLKFFGASRGAVESLGGGLGGFIGTSRGCAARGFGKTYAPQIKHATGRIVCVSCKYVRLWY